LLFAIIIIFLFFANDYFFHKFCKKYLVDSSLLDIEMDMFHN
jgi:hypothetical protein